MTRTLHPVWSASLMRSTSKATIAWVSAALSLCFAGQENHVVVEEGEVHGQDDGEGTQGDSDPADVARGE